jgi:hypothetical protein
MPKGRVAPKTAKCKSCGAQNTVYDPKDRCAECREAWRRKHEKGQWEDGFGLSPWVPMEEGCYRRITTPRHIRYKSLPRESR